MKILIGVCGIGNGHCIRQYEIAKQLIKKGYSVQILTYNQGINFFKDTGIKIHNVYVPMILYKGEKLNWWECIRRNIFKIIPGTFKNIFVYWRLIKNNFIPDVCISDYEPVVAKFAKKINRPIINIDQHSKFIYMDENTIDGYSCVEEKKRLSLFFPKENKKYVVSFYNVNKNILPPNVKIIYPIIRGDLLRINKKNIKEKKVVVYFSKFINIPIKQSFIELFELFKKFKEYKFIIFSTDEFKNNYKTEENIIIEKNDRKKFIEELGQAECVISTAGHTLISEALYCGIPIFVIPLPTFDQHYCGKFIKDNNIGFSSKYITEENLEFFFKNINKYKENINKCENLIKPTNSLGYLIDEIEKYKN